MESIVGTPTACDPLAQMRARAQEVLEGWLERLAPFFDQPQQPDLPTLSDFFTQHRGELLGGLLKVLLELLYQPLFEQRAQTCPGCAQRLSRKRQATKAGSTLQGEINLERPYFYCSHCRQGFHPLDDLLRLAPAHHQYDVQKQAVRLSTEVPFETAAELFEPLTGIALGNHCLHEMVNAVGPFATLERVIPERGEIEERIAQAPPREAGRLPLLAVACDGAHVPTRPRAGRAEKRGPGAWKEAKGARLYLVGKQDRILPLASWHQITDSESFTEDLRLIAQRIPEDQLEIALLGDGSGWLWKAMTACFPTARPVLDYYHCAQHVFEVANAQYPDPLQARQWAEVFLARLSAGYTTDAIAGLRRMRPRSDAVAELMYQLAHYLKAQKQRLHYDDCRAKGIPIGSGAIESAHKFLCHTRLKRSGAWWIQDNANTMLRLRCAIYNATYDNVFAAYVDSNHSS